MSKKSQSPSAKRNQNNDTSAKLNILRRVIAAIPAVIILVFGIQLTIPDPRCAGPYCKMWSLIWIIVAILLLFVFSMHNFATSVMRIKYSQRVTAGTIIWVILGLVSSILLLVFCRNNDNAPMILLLASIYTALQFILANYQYKLSTPKKK